ncbi:MAG: T9SS type A sorting domain-containing protein [Bacteroidia bacterium]|nr:T9SS type A sorting domain-containing protein [Bacteroidia bacterium]
MRKILILILLFSVTGVLGQNYRNICSPGTTYFKNSNNSVNAFRLDSVYQLGNGDTVFISYRTIRDTGSMCMDTTYGSILGRMVLAKSDGRFYFFNKNQDSICLHTQAVVGDTWVFCHLANQAYIEARVDSIFQDNILGINDSVKSISLQAKNQAGDTISFFMNGKSIQLSKSLGLTKIYGMYSIADGQGNLNPTPFELAGKTSLGMGLQDLSWKDIYNFNVGDEFHYSGYIEPAEEWKYIKRVIAKNIYGNLDSVRYMMDYCKIQYEWWHPPPNVVTIHDTIMENYNFISLSLDSSLIFLPLEFKNIGDHFLGYCYSYYRYLMNNRQNQVINSCGYSIGGNPGDSTCWTNPFEGIPEIKHFGTGLGLTSYTTSLYSEYMDDYWDELVYFKKGNETWGTPVAADCEALFAGVHEINKSDPKISVYPNPAEDQANVNIQGTDQSEKLNILLFDCTGREVLDIPADHNPVIIHRNGLPAGLYLLIVRDKSGNPVGTVKLVFQ